MFTADLHYHANVYGKSDTVRRRRAADLRAEFAARRIDAVASTEHAYKGPVEAYEFLRDTIGDEVASLCEQLEAITSTPQKFAGGGFRQARDHFNELAMLFAIIQQSHEASDWKPAAQPLRQQFSRAASVCKVSTPQVYEVAKAATDNLSSLLKDTYEPTKQAKAAGEKVYSNFFRREEIISGT